MQNFARPFDPLYPARRYRLPGAETHLTHEFRFSVVIGEMSRSVPPPAFLLVWPPVHLGPRGTDQAAS